MAGKKSGFGLFLLWFVMVAMIAVAVTEFYGPYRGWLLPAADRVRDRVSEMADEYEKTKAEKERKALEEEKARKLAEQQKADSERVNRKRIIGLDEFPRTGMSGRSLVHFQTDGEVTPADLPMQESMIPEPPKRITASDVLARLNGRKLVRGSKEYQTYFSEIYSLKLKDLDNPRVGSAYTVELRDKSTVDGSLQRLKKDAAILRTQSGAMRELQARQLSLKSLRELFPKVYAEKFAAHYMRKVTVKPNVVATTDPGDTGTPDKTDPDSDPETYTHFEREPTKIPTKVIPNALPELKKYDTTYAKTPPHLASPIQYFGNWLEARGKSVGGRIANKLYAKQHGRQVVLYMEMSRYFLAQKKDVRQMTCQQFWQMWSRECKNRGKTSSPKNAHVVMVDGTGKIVGGSKERDSDNIWVK